MKYVFITTDLSRNTESVCALLSANGLTPEEGETIVLVEPDACENALAAESCGNAPATGDMEAAPTPAVTVIEVPYFRGDVICDALVPLIRDADLVLFAGGVECDELALRLSMRTGGSTIAAACDLSIGADHAIVRRKTYAGHMIGTWQLDARPWCISLDRALMVDPSEDCSVPSQHDVRHISIDWSDPLDPSDRSRSAEEMTDNDLLGAGFILAAGRGVGSASRAAEISEYAESLGASLGASRPVVMSAWLPMDRLLGVSGSLASHPKLVIVCGASGAPAFYAGIESADAIIAINADADAPIMKKADLSICGDWKEILSSLIKYS